MKKLPLIISFPLVVLVVACYYLFPSFQNFINEAFDVLTSGNETRISQWVAQFKLAGPLVLVLIMVVQMFLFVVPNVFLMVVAIVSYGPVWGAIISFLGVFASSSLGFLIGRHFGPVVVHRIMSESAQKKTSQIIKDYGVPAIFITRISSLSNDSLSMVAGLLKMSYRKYISATMGGITPLIVLLAIYGNNGKILKALVWIAAVSLILLIIYIIIDKRRKAGKA